MSEQLIANVNMQLAATLSAPGALNTPSSVLSLPNFLATAFPTGTGAGKVNQMFYEQNTLAASGSKVYDLYAFGGALDALGFAFTLTRLKLLLIQILGNAQYYYGTVATVHAGGGGTGYAVNDVLKITSAGQDNSDMTVRVSTVSSGVVTGVVIVTPGSYSAQPTTSANATSALTGGGSGCTLDLTFATATNLATAVFTDADTLVIGNQNDSTAWTSLLGTITATMTLNSGSALAPGTIALHSGGQGWAVLSPTNYKLKVLNGSSTNPLTYNFVAIGSTA